jgi:hypothetical protein
MVYLIGKLDQKPIILRSQIKQKIEQPKKKNKHQFVNK